MKLYSIYDLKAQTYAPPFVARNDEVAVRMILEACRDARIPLAQYPADFQLRVVASWDDEKAVVADELAYPLVLSSVEELIQAITPAPVEAKENA